MRMEFNMKLVKRRFPGQFKEKLNGYEPKKDNLI